MTSVLLIARMRQRDNARGRQIERWRREIELAGEARQKSPRKGADTVAVRKDDRSERIGLNRDGDSPGAAERGKRILNMFWNEPHWSQDRLRDARALGARNCLALLKSL